MNHKQLQASKLIKLDEIHREDERFQTRHFNSLSKVEQHQAEKHSKQQVKELKAELQSLVDNPDVDPHKAHLDPVIIWKPLDSPKSIIVNGFHRYDAYLLFNKAQKSKKTRKQKIPAQLFVGTEDEAEAYAASLDTKPYLPKSQAQKANIAWKMIAEKNTAVSKMNHAKAATWLGISHSTVRRMRTMAKAVEKREVKHVENWKHQQHLWRTRNDEKEDNQPVKDLTPMIQRTSMQALRYIQELLGVHANDGELIKQVLLAAAEHAGISSAELDEALEPMEMDF